MNLVRRYTLAGALAAAGRLYLAHAGALLAIGLAATGPALVVHLVTTALEPDPGAPVGGPPGSAWAALLPLLDTALSLVLGTLGAAATTRAIHAAALGRPLDAREALRAGTRDVGPLLGASVRTGAVVLVGLLLLVVPGIVALVGLAFVGPVVVLEGARGAAALRRSWALAMVRPPRLAGAVLGLCVAHAAVVGGAGALPAFLAAPGASAVVASTVWARLVGAAWTPLSTAVVVFLYYDARLARQIQGAEVALADAAVP